MKFLVPLFLAFSANLSAGVKIDNAYFGKSLGEWKKGDPQTVDYRLSGSEYRTYKPETTATPEGGLYASVRIDHQRGWLSSNDHAVLEITINPLGIISAAKTTIAIQGRSISSDIIFGTNEAGKALTGADRAVQVGTDLIADLSSKLLRERIVEAGRVSFPAAIRHNYNHLYQSIRLDGNPVPPLAPVLPPPAEKQTALQPAPAAPAGPEETAAEPPPPVAKPVPSNAALEINPYGGTPSADPPAGE